MDHRVAGAHRMAAVLFAALAACLFGSAVIADDYYWNNPYDGFFDLEQFWNDGNSGVPGQEDVAIFDIDSAFSVLFIGDQVTDRLLVRSGIVTFDMGSRSYTLLNPLSSSPAVVVGEDSGSVGQLVIAGEAQLNGTFATLGKASDSTGSLTLDGSGTSIEISNDLRIGDEGIGLLSISNGSTLTTAVGALALAADSWGEATISGHGTQWTCEGPLTVGKHGDGDLIISDAADVSCTDAIIGQVEDSTGAVTVTHDARWTIDGTLDVGMTGFGSLLIEDGASVANHTFATIGTYDSWPYGNGGVGEVTVDAHYDDASWTIDGDLYIGFFGEGTLSILGSGGYSDASVTVAGDVFIGLNNPGTLMLSRGGAITIGGNLSPSDWDYDRLVIELGENDDYLDPAIDAAGAIGDFEPEVILDDGYEPQAGDTFAIAHADEGIGAFSFILPELPEDLQWQVIQDEHDVSLAVVPTLTGDINGDGVVNTEDLLLLLAAWGDCPGCPEDLDGDGVVNTTDLLTLLANWG